ncbi:MAG: glucosidase, partial [Planctomycetaceae bacterium]|nr:glucosidase [Planctomycetaceae bacterium]
MNTEHARLRECREESLPWKKWGPYLSERQWGTVREDYSEGGNAWDYFSHDQARSRAYRWGEDGLAGISDDQQRLCFAIALWNGVDPILKERLFGLTNSESNHGEDVKEYYYYLDSTPTHSYMKYLYRYPQAAFPYDQLVETSRRRSRQELEYELLDTGVFDDDRYFDIFVEYAKQAPEDMLVRITIHNRGPDAADLHVLPTLWFRNQWSWKQAGERPVLQQAAGSDKDSIVRIADPQLGERYLYCAGAPELLFTENETNSQRIFGVPNRTPYVKDGINNCVIHGNSGAVNPQQTGTKASAHYRITVAAGGSRVLQLRLTDVAPAALPRRNGKPGTSFGAGFDDCFDARRRDSDEFYASITPAGLSEDQALVMRQALAGMLWSKQYYHY